MRTVTGARVCLTPGAIFHIALAPERASVCVEFGRTLNLTEDQAAVLDNGIHDALESVLAPYYGTTRP